MPASIPRRHILLCALSTALGLVAPAAFAQTKLKVAAIYTVPVEQQWVSRIDKALKAAVARGEIDYVFSENVSNADYERVMRQYAEAGNGLVVGESFAVEDAARRILSVKLRAGLFELQRPAERPWSNSPSFGGAAHREIAREAVRKSLVLLKNDSAVLPLRKTARVLVSGKNADDRGHQCGGFTVDWQGTHGNDRIVGGTSIWEGIRAVVSGAQLSQDGSAADATAHDVAIVVIGETPYAEGMGDLRHGGAVQRGSGVQQMTNLAPYGSSLTLAERHPEDLETIRRITAKGIPVVVVLVSGRPLVVNAELAESRAFVAAWLPGSEGQGVADVLFGDHRFTGRLSFSWPREPAGEFGKAAPLFARGYGLQ